MSGQSVYLCSTEHCSQLGDLAREFMGLLGTHGESVGVFRPIVASASADDLLDSLSQPGSQDLLWGATADDLLKDPDRAMAQIIERYQKASERHDLMLILGSEYDCSLAPIEFAWNTRVAANIGVPMVLLVSGSTVQATQARIDVAVNESTHNLARVLAVIVLGEFSSSQFSTAVPVFAAGGANIGGSVADRIRELGAVIVCGSITSADTAQRVLVANRSLRELLPLVGKNDVVVFSGDRADVSLGLAVGAASGRFQAPAAAVAAGPWELDGEISKVWKTNLPKTVLLRTECSFDEAVRHLDPSSKPVASAHLSSDGHDDLPGLASDFSTLLTGRPVGPEEVVTPLQFENTLLHKAHLANRHIVLPEGVEERIIRAAQRLVQQGVCRLTLLGNVQQIKEKAAELGVDLESVSLIDPMTSDLREKFAEKYAQLRAKKGVTIEQARERVADVSYFGTMMVREGLADGMVSGCVNTTAHTIRPALEVIKTRPGISVVSSVFLMCLKDHVLVFGDCAVNPNPTPEQVAEIAVSSASTAKAFGIEPRVAMLSYSTGTSGSGPDVDQTVEATRILHERAPELNADGPLQYDAAVDPTVARTKAPESSVAGKATVLIFPDLKTGNTTYKAVQRSAGALAIGPVLQGLNKPVNDLSRGALVSDIVNTVAITAIQAGLENV